MFRKTRYADIFLCQQTWKKKLIPEKVELGGDRIEMEHAIYVLMQNYQLKNIIVYLRLNEGSYSQLES
jgi:hypothetical protein